jgi:L-fuculose-phosphate aldolase
MDPLAEQIAALGRRLFERRLLDIAGGNISARAGDRVFITPRYSGGRKHWQLVAGDIVSGPFATDDLLADPAFSREGKVHLAIYRAFADAGAVIHAHAFHVLPFCAARRPIAPVLEQTHKFGVVEVVAEAPAHSDDLAEQVVAGLRGQEEKMRGQAAAVLAPRHGIIVVGKDLLAAADALERIDWNAWCILAQRLLAP